jgi:predicted RNase H-like HicB family nuclease
MNIHESADGTKEYSATIHEVYYTKEGVASTDEISPMGCGETPTEALQALKDELQLMLESVQYVMDGKTSLYDYENSVTHDPGAKSLVSKELKARYSVIDPDDDYMDEKYGDE